MKTGQRKARLFSTSIATKDDAQSIVDTMDRVFGELEEAIAKGLR